jgi:hypothetical protein
MALAPVMMLAATPHPLAISSQVLPRRPDANLQNACAYGRPVSRRVAYFRSMLGGILEVGRTCRPSSADLRALELAATQGLNAKTFGEAIHHLDAGGILLALNGTAVGAVNVCAMRKLFLRQASGLPKPA